MDFRNIDLETWLVVITRDGFLCLMEPNSPYNLADWQFLDRLRVCPMPQRGEETSFKVRFQHDPTDITHTLFPGWYRKSLSLVIAVKDSVSVYRTDAGGRHLYHAIELDGHTDLVRDVSWANGSIRGYDLIASACRDGRVRIFEVYTSFSNSGSSSASQNANRTTENNNNNNNHDGATSIAAAAPTTSGIGSALANRSHSLHSRHSGQMSPFKHSYKQVANIDSGHIDVWQVEFSCAGELTSGFYGG